MGFEYGSFLDSKVLVCWSVEVVGNSSAPSTNNVVDHLREAGITDITIGAADYTVCAEFACLDEDD